jgi:hypothetical protein
VGIAYPRKRELAELCPIAGYSQTGDWDSLTRRAEEEL